MIAFLFFGALGVGLFCGGAVAGMLLTERWYADRPRPDDPRRELARIVARPRSVP
jgi:hypothetical protein